MLASDYEDNFVLRSLVNNLSYPEAGIIFLESLIEKHYLEDDWSQEGEDDETEITMTYDSLIELLVWLLNQYNPSLQLEIVSPGLVAPEKKQKKYVAKGAKLESSMELYVGHHGGLQLPGYGGLKDYEGEFYIYLIIF